MENEQDQNQAKEESSTAPENYVTVKFKAEGSTCHSCEELIKRQAMKVDGVRRAEFKYESERGLVTFDRNKTNIKEIFRKIEEKGYTPSLIEAGEGAGKRPEKKSVKSGEEEYFSIDKKLIGTIGLILGILIIGFFILKFADIITVPDISKNMSLGLIFVVGLLTGFHCVAMCGGFVVGYTAKAAQEGKPTHKAHLAYGFGKTVSYTIIGALFGLLGSIIAFTPQLRGTLGILAGIFLLLFGLRMLGVFSFLRGFGFRQPAFISRFTAKNSERGPLVIGLLNGLMIACGPLQAIYVLAAGTGSWLEGAKMLFVFGLGTLPVMLGFGYITSFISAKATHKILKFSGVVVIVLGLLMLNNGLVLTGSGLDFKSIASGSNSLGTIAPGGNNLPGGSAATPNNVAVQFEGYQEIHMTVDASGYSPDTFVLKKGVPVHWIIDAKQLTSCNRAIQVPGLALKFDLQQGEQTINFTPPESGTIKWSCWMGMIPGTFIVQDDITPANAAATQQAVKTAQAAAPNAGGGCGCGMGSAPTGAAGAAPAGSCH